MTTAGWQITRRRFLGLSVATAVGIASARFLLSPGALGRLTLSWVSPRRSLAVVDDYPLWVAIDRGYMGGAGIDLHLAADSEPGPKPSSTTLGSITFPSPARLVSSADRGQPATAIFQLCAGSVFGFALPDSSGRRRPRDLSGARIAVGDESWRQVVEPLLIEAGVDPRSTTLVVVGDRWLNFAASGGADAALSWRGLEQTPGGRRLRHLVGDRWSQLPANAYAVEATDLATGRLSDGLTRFLKAVVMGLEFAEHNPRAAAQITRRLAPGLASAMSPQQTVDALAVPASIYSVGRRHGRPWGFHEPARWQRYVAVAEQAGMVKSVDPHAIYTNRFIAEANSVELRGVALDATTFELDPEFKSTNSPTGG